MRTALWILAALPLLALALIGFRYLIRGTPVQHVRGASLHGGTPSVRDEEFTDSVELLARVTLRPGNAVEVLCCGDDTFPRLWDDLRSAQRSITLQMYYCKPGVVADQMAAILQERARAGVRVLFLRDAFGGQDLPKQYLRGLRDAGVEVADFRPVRWYQLETAYNRSHIRVVTVDGMIGYTGGFGLDDKWLGDGLHENQWRDTNVRFTGPAVRDLQAAFATGWAEATGELLVGDLFFVPLALLEGAPGVHAGVMHAAPTIGSTAADRLLALTMAGARQRLYITNAYFVPDEDLVEQLCAAARRDVDVRVLTAGERTDVTTALWAGRARYERLLTAGVRIYEYQPATLHAKTFVVDGCFGSVGTMNFDNRSIAFNDESNFLFRDAALGELLLHVFHADLRHAREFTLEAVRRQPLWDRVRERVAALFTRVL
jgi:cardiolipin synthase